MLDHPETERTDPHEEDVGRVWRDSGRVYGAGRIKAALKHERIVMSSRRINRIMKAGGMAGSYSMARPRTSSAANSMATPRARGRRRALVGDEPGEQPAALAFDLRVDTASRRGRADGRVGLIMPELAARVHAFGTFDDGHTHRDARPLRPPAPGARAVPLAARQVPPEVQCPARLGADPLVEAFVADPHMRVGRPFDLQPSLDEFGCPSLAQRVHDPFEQRVVRHAHGLAWLSGALFGLVLRGHGRVELFCFNVCSTGSAVFFRSVG